MPWGILHQVLERHTHHHTHAIAMGNRQIGVIATTYELNMQNLEDVMDTRNEFDIRSFGIHNITTFRKYHQCGIAGITG